MAADVDWADGAAEDGRVSRCRWPIRAAGAAVMALAAASCASPATDTAPITGIHVPRPETGLAANWTTYNRTAARSGVSVSSPAAHRVRRSWTTTVDGQVYAQPLIVGSEIIVATENDTVYALSASNGRVRWRHHLAAPVTGGLPCGNIDPSGITGTPVADVATGRLWVVTFTRRPTFEHTLWALDLRTGRTLEHRRIDASGSDPRAQQERGALVLLGSRVYVPFGGLFGDCSDYFGRVVAAPISGAGGLLSFRTLDRQSGIWAPAGEAVRGDSLYVATGNGSPANRVGDSDSVLRLSQTLNVQGRFTPANFVPLSRNDLDLGSAAPALLPGGMVFQAGKQGVGYVLDGARLGGTGGQLAKSQVCDGAFGASAVDGRTVVMSCFGSLRAIEVVPGKRGAAPRIRGRWSVSGISPGPPIIAGGVVWDLTRDGGTLSGYRFTDGKRVFSVAAAASDSDFPPLAASGSRLIVPEGRRVVSFVGI
jgi:polyvinyl alcohol dehydrogenase (cytochrome)